MENPQLSKALNELDPGTVYVITVQGPKVKRSATGKYVSHDLTEVILLDEKGRFRRMPIDQIIRINFYLPERAPF